MNTLARIVKHRWLDHNDAKRAIGSDGLTRLMARVAASEQQHSGEIRICIEAGLPMSYLWRSADARERAIAMFGKLRVWDTEHNNGVLIYLLLAEHRIEIVADRGLDRLVDAARWQRISQTMSDAFRSRQFEAGLSQAVDAATDLLVQHFPLDHRQPNPDELPNSVWLIG